MGARRKRRRRKAAALCVLAAVLCVLLWAGARGAQRMARAQAAASVRSAVLRAAVQCYAVEGLYPQTLAYLEQNYGLQVNHQAFVVSYEAFASNVMPNVKVLEKN